jgi:Protein of unknown function (DUF1501)
MGLMTPTTDQTMAALLDDLHQRGLLTTTLVVMATEFGRSPKISNETAGRGHHPSVFTWWLAGAGIKGGYVHGSSDEVGNHVADKPVTMPDLNATIAQALGIDLQHIEHSPSGRPFTVADKGAAVVELFVSHVPHPISSPALEGRAFGDILGFYCSHTLERFSLARIACIGHRVATA